MCYLYFIHRPCHTDVLTEGYIGVSNNPKRRFKQHRRSKQNRHLYNAFQKYDDIVSTILWEGPEDECYKMENEIRPNENIGWNIVSGGGKPPFCEGRKISKEHVEILRQATFNMSEESKERKANNIARDWRVTTPEGDVFMIHNLKKFCRENNLDQGAMVSVTKGKYKHHKGWKCEYA